jgi:glycosyltransferase involved in cell wall biosynthesis
VRVLHVSHTGAISGGEHSLLTLLAHMPPESELGVACPPGPLADRVRALGLPVHRIPGSSASFRLHPLHTAKAMAEIGAAAIAVRGLAQRYGATVLHANSVRAGLVTGLAGTARGPASVVHVRDALPAGATAMRVRLALSSRSDALIAISRYVQKRVEVRRGAASISVIDNPVDLSRFDPSAHDVAECRQMLAAEHGVPLLGIIGQITPWKGQDTLIRAMPLIHERHPGATLAIVGEVKFAGAATRLDNRAYLDTLHGLIAGLGLYRHVRFLGERQDVPQIMRALDILLVPSVAEPFGRTVAEAMAMGTSVIATSEGGPSEMIEHGVHGLLVPPGAQAAWADAVNQILGDPAASRDMAETARQTALKRFDAARHAQAVSDVLTTASEVRHQSQALSRRE